ncbi:MAG: cysteine--tRNA ligase, partial [Planctomycetota bacterium]|nr:cysteine--tRNA ligase [Planctomycetota bacterium]
MVLRLFILQSHYRSPLDFSDEALGAAKEGYERLVQAFATLGRVTVAAKPGEPDQWVTDTVSQAHQRFNEAMDDDFNTAGAVASLFDLARACNALVLGGHDTAGGASLLHHTFLEQGTEVLGLTFARAEGEVGILFKRLVVSLIERRESARKASQFGPADIIRKALLDADIILEDTPQGTKWRFK